MMAQMNRLVRVGGTAGCELTGGSGLDLIRLVDCRFLRSWSMWPLPVWMLLGRCFFTCCGVSPWKEERKPASTALRSVEGTGEPNEALWNCAKSLLAVSLSMIALQVEGTVGCGRACSPIWTIHMLFEELR